MAAGAQSGFTKATVATDSARVDLALPHAASLGELLPELLRLTGAAPASAARGWELSRFGQAPLDADAAVADLDLRDGELIYLAPRALHPAGPVFDDVADAIGEAAAVRSGNWRENYSRATGLALGAVLLLSASASVPLVGGTTAAICGFAAAAVSLLLAVIASRAYADASAATLLAVVASAFAAAAGYAVLTPHGDAAARLVLAAALGAGVAAVGLLATGDHGYVFTGIILLGAVGAADGLSSLLWQAAPASIAAFTVAGVVLLAPLAPLTSLRLAGVALPTVPGTVAELRSEGDADVDGAVVARTRRANDYLSALVVSGAGAATAAAAVLAFHHGSYGRVLCLCAAMAMSLRARLHTVLPQRLALLLGGAAAYAALASAVALGEHGPARTAVAFGALAAAGAVAFVAGLVVPGRRSSPYWGRALDWLELLSLTALVPLAVAVPGWYAYFHGLAG